MAKKDDPMRDASERRAFADRQTELHSIKCLVIELLQQGALADKCDVVVRGHDAPDAVVLDFEDGTSWRLNIERAD